MKRNAFASHRRLAPGLTGVMYVLDEPSIGLHQRDNDRLIGTLKHLRDLDNTVIVVEHDEDMIRASDYVVDMGPGAGEHGGQVVAQRHAERSGKPPRFGPAISSPANAKSPYRKTPRQTEKELVIKGARQQSEKRRTASARRPR